MADTINAERMAAQENVALARTLFDPYNNRQSDPTWLGKCLTTFAADAEVIDIPSGATFHGPDGFKRFILFFAENFPDLRVELIDVFAIEDRVVLEGIWRWNDTGPLYLPSAALKASGRSGEVRCCQIMQIRKGKITSLHGYYDLTALLEQLGFNAATAQAM